MNLTCRTVVAHVLFVEGFDELIEIGGVDVHPNLHLHDIVIVAAGAAGEGARKINGIGRAGAGRGRGAIGGRRGGSDRSSADTRVRG